MVTDKPYATETPATGHPRHAGRLGAAILILCAFLAIAWIGIHKTSAKPGPQTAASHAVGMCKQAVRQKATHPASVNFSEFGSQPPTHMRGGGYQVRLAFEEKDALGDAIANMAICTVKDGKLQAFKEPKP